MERRGLVIVHTGDGKGKTTAALGLSMRAWGDGMKVVILQFIKGGWEYGEMKAIENLSKADGRIEIRRFGLGFTQRDDSKREEHIQAAREALKAAEYELKRGAADLLILDEINYAVRFGLISEDDVLSLIKMKPDSMHLVLTGRDAGEKVIEVADLVTEMRLVKHPFQKGIKAQKGIEF